MIYLVRHGEAAASWGNHPDPGLSDKDLDALVAFLDSLTGATARAGRLGVPETVPSGLKVDR